MRYYWSPCLNEETTTHGAVVSLRKTSLTLYSFCNGLMYCMSPSSEMPHALTTIWGPVTTHKTLKHVKMEVVKEYQEEVKLHFSVQEWGTCSDHYTVRNLWGDTFLTFPLLFYSFFFFSLHSQQGPGLAEALWAAEFILRKLDRFRQKKKKFGKTALVIWDHRRYCVRKKFCLKSFRHGLRQAPMKRRTMVLPQLKGSGENNLELS